MFAQQEDAEMSLFYVTSWYKSVNAVMDRILANEYQGLSVMGQGLRPMNQPWDVG